MVKLVDFDKNANSWKPHKIQLFPQQFEGQDWRGGPPPPPQHTNEKYYLKDAMLTAWASFTKHGNARAKGCRTWTAKSERKQRATQRSIICYVRHLGVCPL